MSWAYLCAAVTANKSKDKLFLPLVLILGAIPDIDLFLARFGVVHRTFTHSLFLWLIVFVPFLIIFRRRSLPYLAAVLSHFLFGDFLFDRAMILWPFSQQLFGFRMLMASTPEIALEIVGLLFAAGVSYFNGDLKRLLAVNSTNFFMVVPFLAVLASMLRFPVDWLANPLLSYILPRNLPAALVVSHVVLLVGLGISTLQGLRSSRSRSRPRSQNAIKHARSSIQVI